MTSHRDGWSIVSKDHRCFVVEPCTVTSWSKMFPLIDVQLELNRAKAWHEANPQKRKTFRGMGKFLLSWMSRTNRRLEDQLVIRQQTDTSAPLPEHTFVEDEKPKTCPLCKDKLEVLTGLGRYVKCPVCQVRADG